MSEEELENEAELVEDEELCDDPKVRNFFKLTE